MKYIVYLTVNKINHKVYVGVHKTSTDAFDGYYGCGCTYKDSKNKRLKGFPAAFKKYGKENFKRITLKEFPYTEEGMKAAYYMESKIVNATWVKSKMTYNITLGGKYTIYETLKKEISQYSLDGKFIRTWSSITEAEETLGLSSISQCLIGKSKYCGDFQWRYYSENESDIEPVQTKEKTVYQFDLQGNLLKVWKSGALASKEFSNPAAAKTAIHNACKGITRQAYGYYWSYKDKFEFRANKSYTAVAKYTDDGLFVESYTSIAEAARENNIKTAGNIQAAIVGRQKRCGGFRWRYYYGNNNNIAPLK